MRYNMLLGFILTPAFVLMSGCAGMMGTRTNYVRMEADNIDAELSGGYINGRINAENFRFISAPGKAKSATGAEEIFEINENFYPMTEPTVDGVKE